MKSKYNYNFNDVLENLYGSSISPLTDLASDVVKDFIENNLSNGVAGSLSEIGTLSGGTWTWANYVASVINNVYQLHHENYCVFSDVALSSVSIQSKLFMMKFLTLLNQTAFRYKSLLSAYDTEKTKLLDKLETTNTGLAKFNDTPQGSGDYSDDTHTSNLTRTTSTTSTEVMTPIQRLKEIQDGFSDVLARWSEEFDNLFLEEANLDYEN